MFAIICRRRLWVSPKDSFSLGPQFIDPTIAVFVKTFSSKESSLGVCKNDSEQSSSVSFLINSCGLSSKDALSVSKKVRIKSPEKADAVLELLRKYGFTNAHIAKLVAISPRVLVAKPEKTLLPKLEFFCSIGVPLSVLAQRLTWYPTILYCSMKNHLIPSYKFIKSIVGSHKRVVDVFSRHPRVFKSGWPSRYPSNIAILRERGLPESFIASSLVHSPRLMILVTEKFATYVDRAVEMGFDRTKITFIHALQVFASMSESTLKHKMDVYRRWGWSESEISAAFLKHPLCMKCSEKKIMATMDFLVNKMGFKPVDIAEYAVLLSYSLEKRMKPRCLVVGILNAKGLLKKKISSASLLIMSEEKFLKKYIADYQDDIPQLLSIYQGKLTLDEMGFSQDIISK